MVYFLILCRCQIISRTKTIWYIRDHFVQIINTGVISYKDFAYEMVSESLHTQTEELS